MDWHKTLTLIISVIGIVLILVSTPFVVKRRGLKKQELVLFMLTEISVLFILSSQVLGSFFVLGNLRIYMDLTGLALALLSFYWYAKATTSKRGQP